MITNERQYRITKGWLKKFEGSALLNAKSEPPPDVHPRIHQAATDALASEAEVLRGQLREYERLRAGRVKQRILRSLDELPKAIIEARIAAHLTQKGLADRLGVAEQQVQRWEATDYAGVSIQRLQQVVDALGAKISEKLQFRTVSPSTASQHTFPAPKPGDGGGQRGPADDCSRSNQRGTTNELPGPALG